MIATDPDVADDERAELACLVNQLPRDLDAGGPALRELRERWGITAGHIWPEVGRLALALRVVGDRRRRAVAAARTAALR
jgi:hypothetical protein